MFFQGMLWMVCGGMRCARKHCELVSVANRSGLRGLLCIMMGTAKGVRLCSDEWVLYCMDEPHST